MLNIIFTLIIGILLGLIIYYVVSRSASAHISNMEKVAAPCSESEVRDLLSKNGYRILEKQKKCSLITLIDGKTHLGVVPVDYVVEKDKKAYAVEVKNEEGVDPNEPLLRRRLFEISRICAPHGALLVDLAAGKVNIIDFKIPASERDQFIKFLTIVLIVFLVVIIIGLFILLKLF